MLTYDWNKVFKTIYARIFNALQIVLKNKDGKAAF